MVKQIKSLFMLLMIVSATFLVACNGQKEVNNKKEITQDTSIVHSKKNISPKGTVEVAFGALTSLNTKEFNEYIKYEDTIRNGIMFKNNVLFGDNIDGESKDYMKTIVSKLSYKILHSEERGNIATVKVQITNLDLSDIDKRIEEETLKENPKNQDNLFTSLIRSTDKMEKYDVTLSLEKSDEGWKINMTKEFARAIYGDMPSFIYNVMPSSEF